MTKANQLQLMVANERVAYQGTGFFNELSEFISELRSRRTLDMIPTLEKMSKRCSETMGFTCNFYIEDREYMNAFIQFPKRFANHTYMTDEDIEDYKQYLRGMRTRDGMWVDGHAVEFTVDYTNARIVSTDKRFLDLEHNVAITRGLLMSDTQAEEVAAIILHELGHGFWYYANMAVGTRMNMMLYHALTDMMERKPIEERVRLIHDLGREHGLDRETIKDISSSRTSFGLITSVNLAYAKKMNSWGDQSGYQTRAEESLADQYVTAHGGGQYLVSGIRAIYNSGGVFNRMRYDADSMSTPGAIMATFYTLASTVIRLILGIATLLVGIGLIILIDVFSSVFMRDSNFEKTYDRPADRFRSVRRYIISYIKKLPPGDERDDLLAQVAEVDKMLDKTTNLRFTGVSSILPLINGRITGRLNGMDFQRKLETLVNNDLYLYSAQLKSND